MSGGFHSKYMAPAAAELQSVLDAMPMQPPERVVYSNVTAEPHAADVGAVKQKMFEQLTAGVKWEDTMNHVLGGLAPDTFYEPAPGAQLKSMMKRISMDNWKNVKGV